MKVNKSILIASSLCISLLGGSAFAKHEGEMHINITPDLESITVDHQGKKVVVKRDGHKGHMIPKMYAKTSRACPPFCIQPASIDPGVETVAELEMVNYLKAASGGDPVLVIDSRTADWASRGTIPGSVNIPWTKLSAAGEGAWDEAEDAPTAKDVMKEHFGVKIDGDKMDFSAAKTLVLFCNGAWCPQSSVNIKSLLKNGYPADKIKWYRGGMQSWVTMGLTTVPPLEAEK